MELLSLSILVGLVIACLIKFVRAVNVLFVVMSRPDGITSTGLT